MQYVPEEPIKLCPEQEECQHVQTDENGNVSTLLRWNGHREVFVCWECGAQLVAPELREAMLLSVASE